MAGLRSAPGRISSRVEVRGRAETGGQRRLYQGQDKDNRHELTCEQVAETGKNYYFCFFFFLKKKGGKSPRKKKEAAVVSGSGDTPKSPKQTKSNRCGSNKHRQERVQFTSHLPRDTTGGKKRKRDNENGEDSPRLKELREGGSGRKNVLA